MTDVSRLTFPELVGGPHAGERLPNLPPEHADNTVLELPHPNGDQEDTTDIVTYLREPIILAGVIVDAWLYRSPARNPSDPVRAADAVAAIARRACR